MACRTHCNLISKFSPSVLAGGHRPRQLGYSPWLITAALLCVDLGNPVPAFAQTVSVTQTNLSRSGAGANLVVGDQYAIAITSPYPFTPISSLTNGVLYPNFATTDANGAWSATATARDPGLYVETLSVGDVPAAPLNFFVLATQPTEVMQNTSNPSISPNLIVGDSFVQTITAGPNAAYQQVTTVFNGTTYNLGQTDQNGAIVLRGIARDVGSYTITYVVGGIPAAPPLAFTVSGAGTVPSFTPVIEELIAAGMPNLSTTGACTSIAGTWTITSSSETWTIDEGDQCEGQDRFCGNVKVDSSKCGTVTWKVNGSLTDPETGAFTLSATDPSPASCQNQPFASTTDTVTLSAAADCASGDGTHTAPSGSFASHWQSSPASPRIPTSLSLKLGERTVYTGGPVFSCGGQLLVAAAFGYSRCAVYTVLDQKRKPILNSTTYVADETVTVVSSTYAARLNTQSNVPVNKDGKFRDFLALTNASGIPAGTKSVSKQVISIRNTANGAVYRVRVNCIVRSATDVQVNDVTPNSDQSCSGF